MATRFICGFVAAVAWTALGWAAEPFQAKVTEVVKGDVFVIDQGGKPATVRLSGVDSPELAQHFGPEAKAFTSGLVMGKEVTLESQGMDGLGRMVVSVTLADGRVLNHEILDAGLGWYCDMHPTADPKLRGVVAKAIAAKKGLWADTAPLSPWDFRGDAEKHAKEAVAVAEKPAPKEEEKPAVKTVSAKGNLEGIPREQFPNTVPHEVAKFMEDPVVKQLGLSAHKDGSGKMDGIQAANLGPYAPIAALAGLQEGDILHSVNGDVIDSEGTAFNLYNKYKNTRSFQIGIIRNGQPQTLNISVPDFIK